MPAMSNRPTVLLVDGDGSLRNLCAMSLRAANYRVLAAADGEMALQFVSALDDAVDLMIVDLQLADMSGPELALRAGCISPVLFLSSDRVALARARSIATSWTEVLAKPFPTTMLLAEVGRLLGRDHEPSPDAA